MILFNYVFVYGLFFSNLFGIVNFQNVKLVVYIGLFLVVVSLFLSIKALYDIKKNNLSGKGMAIVSLILCILFPVSFLLFVFLVLSDIFAGFL